MTTQERQAAINSLQKSIDRSEKKMSDISADMRDPEIYAESGYYLQEDLNNEIAYCTVLYKKMQRLCDGF